MKKQYSEFAKYYDLVYHFKDYKKEAETIKKLIKKYKKSKGKKLLEAACGTGNYAEFLKNDFTYFGTDASESMLKIARNKFPKLKFMKDDMTNMKVKGEFDVILCLFSSIGYVKTEEKLEKTIRSFSEHLKEGGVVIIEAWFEKSNYKSGNVHLSNYESEEIKVSRATYCTIKGGNSVLDMHWLVAQKNKGIDYFSEKHEMGFFSGKLFETLMRKHDLEIFSEKGLMNSQRKLYIGVKKNS